MFNKYLYCFFTIITLIVVPDLTAIKDTPDFCISDETSDNKNALFIFLDETEFLEGKLGAISLEFLNAFITQAGPIIVSASVIKNILTWKKPIETNPTTLYNKLKNSPDLKERKNIILSTYYSSFFLQSPSDPWIIKVINKSLYLLLPKKYLQEREIDIKDLAIYSNDDAITEAEQKLGLKVNHMHTISSLHEIPLSQTSFIELIQKIWNGRISDYFTKALWDDDKGTSAIFVTNADYHSANNSNIPSWSLYLTGHGKIHKTIANLLITDFNKVLLFLGIKIHTALLYYSSCYAAGINSVLLHKDVVNSVEQTYTFTIITGAIAESVVHSFSSVNVELAAGHLKIITHPFHKDFFDETTSKNYPNYRRFTQYEAQKYMAKTALSLVSFQIKYPGLPWLSILDDEAIVVIGKTLAQHRKKALNINNFFGKKNKEILGILLYAQKIPFEIIIDKKNANPYPPEIISMLPEAVTHHIKKISSQSFSAQELITCFLRIYSIGSPKTFIIDTISGTDGDIKDVVIYLESPINTTYWKNKNEEILKRKSNLFEGFDTITPITMIDRYQYKRILKHR